MNTFIVEGALATTITGLKDKEARALAKEVRESGKAAKATTLRMEVIRGTIFLTLDGGDAATVIPNLFSSMPEVRVSEVSPLEAIRRKSLMKQSGPTTSFA